MKKNEKKQSFFAWIFLVILVVAIFVIAVINRPDKKEELFNKDNTIEEISEAEKIITASKFGEPGTMVKWKIAEDLLTFDAPSEYEVHEANDGNTTFVSIYSPLSPIIRNSIWVYSPSNDMSVDDWVALVIEDLDRASKCDSIVVDDLEMQCWNGSVGSVSRRMYFGSLKDKTYINIGIPSIEDDTKILTEIIDSIDLFPNEDILNNAITVPSN